MFLGGLRDVPSPGTAPDPTLHPGGALGSLATYDSTVYAHRVLSLVAPIAVTRRAG
jgi:hypothetical protein